MKKIVLPPGSLLYLLFVFLAGACASPAVQHHTVEISQMKFIPATLTVQKGDEVNFVNHDMVLHNVTDSTGKLLIDSLAGDVSRAITVSENVNYYCSLHPVMKGRIVVK